MDRDDPIAIVDDDEDNRWSLSVLLEHVGFSVVTFDGGPSFFHYLDSGDPVGLVVLDLNMPEMSGEEVYERLQQDPARAAIPIVVLSGVSAFQPMPGVAGQITKGEEPDLVVQQIAMIYSCRAAPRIG